MSAVPHSKERGRGGREKAGCVSAADHAVTRNPGPPPLQGWKPSGEDVQLGQGRKGQERINKE